MCDQKCGKSSYTMREVRIAENRDEIISKLENGAERYLVDALTHNMVEHLARGADPIAIIDHLLKSHANLQAKLMEIKAYHSQPESICLSANCGNELLKTIKK